MADPLLDDVRALLEGGFGDDRILKQILRACEHAEVISNYERNYVRRLAEKHLGRGAHAGPQPPPARAPGVAPGQGTPPAPGVAVPAGIPPAGKDGALGAGAAVPAARQPSSPAPSSSSSDSKGLKAVLVVAGVALVVLIAAGVLLGGSTAPDGQPADGNADPAAAAGGNPAPGALSVSTDAPAYEHSDIISISGISSARGVINISIENQESRTVWTEEAITRDDGRYSTLIIAGGPGWEKAGTFTITADSGVHVGSDTFLFEAGPAVEEASGANGMLPAAEPGAEPDPAEEEPAGAGGPGAGAEPDPAEEEPAGAGGPGAGAEPDPAEEEPAGAGGPGAGAEPGAEPDPAEEEPAGGGGSGDARQFDEDSVSVSSATKTS